MAGALTAAIASIFSGSAVTADPYYEYTTLLLPGSGTSGTQNNSFLDSGTANGGVGFPITRNGNTTQGTFSPFSQTGWGNYFDGSGNYLKVADGTALDLPGDFTLEGWFYFSSLSSNNGIIGYGSEAASQNGFSLYWAASSVNKLRIYSNGATLLTGTTTLSANTWNHIAIVRSGSGSNNLTVYVNGAVDQTATNTTSFTGVAALGMGIGVNYDGTFYNPFTGYASNIRLVKGQALATGAFTPPTSPVSTSSVGWTGANAAASLTGTVSVLTCQSNRFVDNSSSPLAITVTGSPTVVAFSPFNPTASWSAATYGGSGYFDGNGDYLSNTSDSIVPTTGDFTIEGWFYPSQVSTIQYIFGTGGSPRIDVYINSSAYVGVQTGGSYRDSSTTKIIANAWNYIAITRTGSTYAIFVNGVSQTIAGAGTMASTITNTPTYIGTYSSTTTNFTGYICGLRVSTSVRTGLTTLPTLPYTSDANTSLLLNFTNAGIYDATSKNDLETVGNAQLSNTTAKWGSTSIYMAAATANTDYLVMPASRNVQLGSGDFTIEFWMRPDSVTTSWANSNLATMLDLDPSAGTGTDWWFIHQVNNTVQFGSNATTILTSSASLVATTWQYIALVRSGSGSNNLTFYINGTASGSATYTATIGGNRRLFIGTQQGSSRWYKGYLQDIRITPGVARTITTPTAAFPTL